MKLPRVLVLATLPGWGKRTFMMQCGDFLRRQRPAMRVTWATAMSDIGLEADEARGKGAEAVLLCVDARYASDAFWDELDAVLDERPWASAIVACYDAPPETATLGERPASGEPRRVILSETELAFDAIELSEVAALLDESGAVVDSFTNGAERGCAALVGLRIERLRARSREGLWMQPSPSIETEMLALLDEGSVSHTFKDSRIGQVIRDVHELPAFGAELIREAAGGIREAETVLSRLAALPLFEVDEDETGARQCLWTPAAWEHLRRAEQPAQTRVRLERGLARVRTAGLLVPQLRLSLELGDLEAAEQLVAETYRRILLMSDPRTASIVNEEPGIDAAAHPMLTMLRNQYRIRTAGFSQPIRVENREVLRRLRRSTAIGLHAEMRRSSTIAYAATYAGDRGVALRYLGHLVELLERVEASSRPDTSESDRLVLLDACFLGYWAALQVDLTEEALALAEAMEAWGDAADRLHQVESVCLEAVRDEAGLRSLASDGTAPSCTLVNQAAALIDIEDGRDAEALHAVERLIADFVTRSSRSATDALALLVLAITSGGTTAVRLAESALRDSVEHWDDEVPSTFVTWAAVVALGQTGAKQEARSWLARIDGVHDVHAGLARMSFALWDGAPQLALDALPPVDGTRLPRLAVCVRVLTAAAHAQIGDGARARLCLEQAWERHRAPRLFRFAFRFVPQAVFDELRALVGPARESIGELFEAAAPDRRTLTWRARPRITPSEREILQMLARGMSNAAIAEARFITLGTLRTHLKSLYKKLGVSDRSEALAEAVRFELIEM